MGNHHDEYLVEGGIAANEYRILAFSIVVGQNMTLSSHTPSIRAQQQFPVNQSMKSTIISFSMVSGSILVARFHATQSSGERYVILSN